MTTDNNTQPATATAAEVATKLRELRTQLHNAKRRQMASDQVSDVVAVIDELISMVQPLLASAPSADAGLRGALEPFAKLAEIYASNWGDGTEIEITLGDCRHAAAALAASPAPIAEYDPDGDRIASNQESILDMMRKGVVHAINAIDRGCPQIARDTMRLLNGFHPEYPFDGFPEIPVAPIEPPLTPAATNEAVKGAIRAIAGFVEAWDSGAVALWNESDVSHLRKTLAALRAVPAPPAGCGTKETP